MRAHHAHGTVRDTRGNLLGDDAEPPTCELSKTPKFHGGDTRDRFEGLLTGGHGADHSSASTTSVGARRVWSRAAPRGEAPGIHEFRGNDFPPRHPPRAAWSSAIWRVAILKRFAACRTKMMPITGMQYSDVLSSNSPGGCRRLLEVRFRLLLGRVQFASGGAPSVGSEFGGGATSSVGSKISADGISSIAPASSGGDGEPQNSTGSYPRLCRCLIPKSFSILAMELRARPTLVGLGVLATANVLFLSQIVPNEDF